MKFERKQKSIFFFSETTFEKVIIGRFCYGVSFFGEYPEVRCKSKRRAKAAVTSSSHARTNEMIFGGLRHYIMHAALLADFQLDF